MEWSERFQGTCKKVEKPENKSRKEKDNCEENGSGRLFKATAAVFIWRAVNIPFLSTAQKACIVQFL
jgi:hypothetical protein